MKPHHHSVARATALYIENSPDCQQKEEVPLQLRDMPLGHELEGTDPHIPLMWPVCVSHKIDERSPLYRLDITHSCP